MSHTTRAPWVASFMLLLILPFSVSGLFAADVRPSQPVDAVRALLQRLIPSHADRFVLEVVPGQKRMDVFEIETRDGKVLMRGSSGVALASGVGWYLKHCCHCEVSWCGDQLHLPDPLPLLEKKIHRISPFAHRYFFNYCAFSYTMAWWDWPQWERMIDWMALNGINMPLAVTGQEAVWQKVYRKLGLSEAEIGQFLVGPAYLPFGWMGCMDGWGGPLPQSWIDRHTELEKKILARQRELGMTPVLQGFTGHVPAALKKKYPQAAFRQLPSWCGFPGTYFVDPLDPLFRQIGQAFVEEQTRLFGTDHFYAADTFIEMSPPSSEPRFRHPPPPARPRLFCPLSRHPCPQGPDLDAGASGPASLGRCRDAVRAARPRIPPTRLRRRCGRVRSGRGRGPCDLGTWHPIGDRHGPRAGERAAGSAGRASNYSRPGARAAAGLNPSFPPELFLPSAFNLRPVADESASSENARRGKSLSTPGRLSEVFGLGAYHGSSSFHGQ